MTKIAVCGRCESTEMITEVSLGITELALCRECMEEMMANLSYGLVELERVGA